MGQDKNYDRVAKVFDFFRKGDMRRWGHVQKDHFKKLRGKVLHVGIGMEIINFPPGLDVTAIDLSPKMLDRARWRANQYQGKIRFCLMNAESLAFPDNTFDTVATVCVFCTVPHPVVGLEECRRVLKPGGKLLMFEHVMSKNLIYGLSLKFMSIFTTALEGTWIETRSKTSARPDSSHLQKKMSI
jgi:ubiquinone/menaquinone biosynthesis C-methylase UbiE